MYIIILFFHSTKSTEEKRLRVDIAMNKESIEKEEIIVQWISNECQLAYVLTKQGGNSNTLLNGREIIYFSSRRSTLWLGKYMMDECDTR